MVNEITIPRMKHSICWQWAGYIPVKPKCNETLFFDNGKRDSPNTSISSTGYLVVTICKDRLTKKAARSRCQLAMRTVIAAALKRGELERC